MKAVITAAALAALATPAAAETYTIVASCQLPNGEVGQMVTYTEVFRGGGGLVYPGGRGGTPDYVPDGTFTAYHTGVVRSSLGEYGFSGQGLFIDFGHRGPVFEVVWYSQTQYGLRDAYGSGWGEIMCYIQSVQ